MNRLVTKVYLRAQYNAQYLATATPARTLVVDWFRNGEPHSGFKNLNKQTIKVGQLDAATTHHVIGRRQTVKVKQWQGNVCQRLGIKDGCFRQVRMAYEGPPVRF